MPRPTALASGLFAFALLQSSCLGAPSADQGTATQRPTSTATARQTPRPTERPTPRETPSPTPKLGEAPLTQAVPATVVDVVDGDTIKVSLDGSVFTVRYIGIDTPETVHPSQPVQWLGPEASAANKGLVEGQSVYLERDVSETDQFGRLLRYVWIKDGLAWILVNTELLRRGLATVTTYPPDVRYVDAVYVPAQRAAQAAGLGLWGTPPTPAPSAVLPPPAGNCDPAYPTVCIPPAPPDLDCGDITFRRFTVLPPDPHNFDGNDNDGIGCESG